MRKQYLMLGVIAVILAVATSVGAQHKNPRFGRWKIKSDAPPPSSNIMSYEAFVDQGMKVTESVNARGETTKWWYTTNFDGKDMSVTGSGLLLIGFR